jgi:predicted DNA-binding protein (MmcQ/YjbR family)
MEPVFEVEWVRKHCLSLPHTTEQVQWGDNLVFKIGGKMYAVLPLEPVTVWISFKCAEEAFAELAEREGIIPAPYLARARWVAVESKSALSPAEIKRLLSTAYEIVLAGLPKRTQAALGARAPARPAPRRKRRRK